METKRFSPFSGKQWQEILSRAQNPANKDSTCHSLSELHLGEFEYTKRYYRHDPDYESRIRLPIGLHLQYRYYQESAGKGTKLILSKKLKGPDELAVAFHKHLSQVGMKTVRIFSDRIRDRIRLEGF